MLSPQRAPHIKKPAIVRQKNLARDTEADFNFEGRDIIQDV
jgi:hypothetical protein